MFATATGSSRCCTSCAARSSRCRAISESAKLGRSTTSASKSSPASSRRLGTWIEAGLDLLADVVRSEEHTSELQSLTKLVCPLLLEKKKQIPVYSLNESDQS